MEEEEDGDDDDDIEMDDDDEQEIQPSMSASVFLDPLDLAISEDVPQPESTATESDDESEIDLDDLSSIDGDKSEDDEAATNGMKRLGDREKRKAAVRSMRGKLDGMLLYFFRHLQESIGGRTQSKTAPELAARELASGISSSGISTPTSESANPLTTISSETIRRKALSPAESLAHFQSLLHLFTRQILSTSSTQHVPFLLFLTSSLSASHTDLFLGLLVSQALYATSTVSPTANSQTIPTSQRVASTVYIGSIVCRARFVSDEQARQVMTYLLAYIDGKLHQSRHDELQLFYAVCQAVMLIFCFRWRAFQVDEVEGVVGEMELEGESVGDGRWLSDLDILQRAITSDLNPLMVCPLDPWELRAVHKTDGPQGCNTTIVTTFAQVAHQTNFAYCFSIIEANQQSSSRQIPSTATTSSYKPTPSRQSSISSSITSQSMPRAARQANMDAGLDSYFPFDPFTLPCSKRFIDPLYRTWAEVASVNQQSDDEDSDGEAGDKEGTEGFMTSEGEGKSFASETSGLSSSQPIPTFDSRSYSERRKKMFGKDEGLSSSLEGMSISPNRSSRAGRR